MNAFGIVAPRRLSMIAWGIATTSAFTKRVPAGHGGGVGVACAAAGAPARAVAGVAEAATAFATAVSAGFGSAASEGFVVVTGIVAAVSGAGVLASTGGLST